MEVAVSAVLCKRIEGGDECLDWLSCLLLFPVIKLGTFEDYIAALNEMVVKTWLLL